MPINRRSFLKSTVAAPLVLGVLSGPSFAAETGSIRWLTAENTTGNWDPSANTTQANVRCEFLAYDTLLSYPMIPGAHVLDPEMRLAESFEIIDPHNAVFTLRKGVKFHDGSEMTAEDVKASLEYMSRPGIARGFYPGPVKAEVKDTYKVQVYTEAFMVHSFIYLQVYTPIMRAKDIATPEVLRSGMNGTGPFRYSHSETAGHVFEVFDGYWGASKPAINKVVIRHVPDGNARVLSLLSGEAELIERLEPEQFTSLVEKDAIATYKVNSVENKYLHFRCNKKPFDDWRVRRAAAAAIDRDGILSVVGDAGYAADSVLPPMKLGYTPLPDYGKYDPELCQKLLAEAGYPGGKGLPELEYITSSGFYPKSKEYSEAVAAMLQAQGFPVKLTVMEVAAWNDRYYNKEAGHMIDGGWAPDSPDPDIQLVMQYYSKVGLVTGVNEPEIDKALLKEMSAPTLEERGKIIQTQVLPIVAEKMPNLVLFNSTMLLASSNALKGIKITPSGNVDFTEASFA